MLRTVRASRLAADLARDDQRSPVLVVESGGRPVLMDGFSRLSALQKLGRHTVCTVTLSMGGAETGTASALEGGRLLRTPD